jgi:hypothetical protein
MTTVAEVAPVVVVVIVPPGLAPDVAPSFIATPPLMALTFSVRSSITPDELPACLAVRWATNAATTLQKREILHYL